MVEFRFDIKPLFAQPIVKVSSNLLPHTFRGDRRQALDATSKMSEIIDRLGQLSATSQKLTKPVTTAQRLRMADSQILYLLADVEAGHNGSIIGLLKVGTKDLYLFDETGQTRKIDNAPCILDFYIHESRQRAGLGKDLFETMLSEEHWTPLKCSVDRPSEKLLGFLKKHYGLERTIPQANNFVLYEGFFGRTEDGAAQNKYQTNGGMHITNSPNTQLFGAHYLGDDAHKRRIRQPDAPNIAAQITQISPVGRYGARRPTCSMAEGLNSDVYAAKNQMANNQVSVTRLAAGQQQQQQQQQQPPLAQTESSFKLKTSADGGAGESPSQAQLQQSQVQQAQAHAQQVQAQNRNQNQLKEPNIIHSNSTPKKGGAESSSIISPQFANAADDAVDVIAKKFHNLQATELESQHYIAEATSAEAIELESDAEAAAAINQPIEEITSPQKGSMSPQSIAGSCAVGENFMNMKKPASFQLSKQHTGMKNISFGVGSAVTPTNKMEFDQESREDFGVVKINRHVGKLHSPPPPDNADAMSTVSSGEGLTDQGYYDLKFFHNKLW